MAITEFPGKTADDGVAADLQGDDMDKNFRRYEDDTLPLTKRVREFYQLMHTNQTVDFVKQQHEKWLKLDHFEGTIMEALDKLNEMVDESDPDINVPNIVHAFQTAEAVRQAEPDNDWLQLTGLIHDLGKVMAVLGEPQWAVTGDTYPVGCAFDKSIVYSDWSFEENKDRNHPVYSTPNGIYKAGCGLDNLLMSWTHDEYMYQVLEKNPNTLPKAGRDIVRFHSFYPWHTGNAYSHLEDETDNEKKMWVRKFRAFDIYTKHGEIPNIEELKPYYQAIIDKYMPGKIKF